MTRSNPRVLLLYKDSVYQAHLKGIKQYARGHGRGVLARLKKAHERHWQTATAVEDILKAHKVRYTKKKRGGKADLSGFDRIITVGGDGTFLEAALQVKDQPVLGVNSDPARSVGRFCAARVKNFAEHLDLLMANHRRIAAINRLRFSVKGKKDAVHFLNDLLCCHRNPALMSHYCLQVGRTAEVQRSSGVWVATAAGSTGAVHSAGGKILPLRSARYQYHPRELYLGLNNRYSLTGGILPENREVRITSYMTEGCCCIDGAIIVVPFPFGQEARIARSAHPLRVVGL